MSAVRGPRFSPKLEVNLRAAGILPRARRRHPNSLTSVTQLQCLQRRASEDSGKSATMSSPVIVRSFRDLEAWQIAMDLAVACFGLARELPADERFVFGSQIRRAATSVPSNTAEGHAAGSDGTFLRYLRIARGSLGELDTQIELVIRLGLLPQTSVERPLALLTRTRQLLAGLARSVTASLASRRTADCGPRTADSGHRKL